MRFSVSNLAIPAALITTAGLGLDVMGNSLDHVWPNAPYWVWLAIFIGGALATFAFPAWLVYALWPQFIKPEHKWWPRLGVLVSALTLLWLMSLHDLKAPFGFILAMLAVAGFVLSIAAVLGFVSVGAAAPIRVYGGDTLHAHVVLGGPVPPKEPSRTAPVELEAGKGDAERRNVTKDLLGRYFAQGHAFYPPRDSVSPDPRTEAWMDDTQALIQEMFGVGESSLFLSNAGYTFLGGGKHYNRLDGRLRRLSNLIERFEHLPLSASFDPEKWETRLVERQIPKP